MDAHSPNLKDFEQVLCSEFSKKYFLALVKFTDKNKDNRHPLLMDGTQKFERSGQAVERERDSR